MTTPTTHIAPNPMHEPKATPIGDLARDITLRAALTRIARKADIMRLDSQRGSVARQDAEEIALLAGIAQRCVERGDV
jgi:hypothetical protein